jgi:hypothetical protein
MSRVEFPSIGKTDFAVQGIECVRKDYPDKSLGLKSLLLIMRKTYYSS